MIETDADGHRTGAHDGAPTTLEQAEANLREAVDVGCTNDQHDHVKDYRDAILKAETAKLCGAVYDDDHTHPCILLKGHPMMGFRRDRDHCDVNGETW